MTSLRVLPASNSIRPHQNIFKMNCERKFYPSPPLCQRGNPRCLHHAEGIGPDLRIDNYDWLRDRRDPRVVSYLDAENAYANARLEPIRPLIDELAAELKAREAQQDATVPTAYNGLHL
jgi:oligopeptidase B